MPDPGWVGKRLPAGGASPSAGYAVFASLIECQHADDDDDQQDGDEASKDR